MRILHVITRLILGGAQQNTVICCRAQAAAGHEVHLAFGPIYGPEGSLRESAQASGVHLHELRWLRRAVLPVHDWLATRSLRQLIRQLRPDLVHTHSSKAGILGRAAAWREHVPAVVHTIHGLPFHDRQNPLIHHAYVHAERWAAQRCHALVGITQAMCDAFAAKHIGRPEQFCVIPSGVEIEPFLHDDTPRDVTRKAYGIPIDAPVIGIVARLDPLKGHDDLLDVLPQLRAQHPDVRLLCVGDGWHRKALEQRIEREGLQGAVVLAGLVPPRQVPSLLRAMDVMALPSYQEGQGRTLVEALLCGCAVVGYDVGGIGEVCIDGQTGRLAPVGDREQLARALRSLLDHPDERQRLADQGRAHVLRGFTATVMCQRLDALYQRLVD